MPDPNRLLVVTQPVLGAIGPEEIKRTLPRSQSAAGWDSAEVAPIRATLGDSYELDWSALQAEQERLFDETLKPQLAGRKGFAYFGFAPIPLAIHLGYLVENRFEIDLYQLNHSKSKWVNTPDKPSPKRSALKPMQLPEHGSTDKGPIVIRVSTSARISPEETAEIVPRSLFDLDIALVEPHPDALETGGTLAEVVEAFNLGIARLRALFPNRTAIHLFTAVPVGLAFRLGTLINPTMYRGVVTYQYAVKKSPRYQRAIVLADDGLREEPFLDDAEYDWKKATAVDFFVTMVKAYGGAPMADLILARSGVDRSHLNVNHTPRDYWKAALEVAARGSRLRALVQHALEDPDITAHHREIKRLASGTP
ncbi:SAVED domain-containing protein [Polyangium jinanense]|uniref:SAVED domain-containing protein n=1 Tax=Polyangium jinanense TaxID=2829994 RepID=A0A9X4ASG4_9BACT|nr:SAVED domain-containing protein [Polyangium jinanense]MDC3956340.1 SAVED domain-containing protein [Polyangium jinanense]MDC3982476.1 SAVED domain-containing protein [Polyangium jinanense]